MLIYIFQFIRTVDDEELEQFMYQCSYCNMVQLEVILVLISKNKTQYFRLRLYDSKCNALFNAFDDHFMTILPELINCDLKVVLRLILRCAQIIL